MQQADTDHKSIFETVTRQNLPMTLGEIVVDIRTGGIFRIYPTHGLNKDKTGIQLEAWAEDVVAVDRELSPEESGIVSYIRRGRDTVAVYSSYGQHWLTVIPEYEDLETFDQTYFAGDEGFRGVRVRDITETVQLASFVNKKI